MRWGSCLQDPQEQQDLDGCCSPVTLSPDLGFDSCRNPFPFRCPRQGKLRFCTKVKGAHAACGQGHILPANVAGFQVGHWEACACVQFTGSEGHVQVQRGGQASLWPDVPGVRVRARCPPPNSVVLPPPSPPSAFPPYPFFAPTYLLRGFPHCSCLCQN